MDDVNKKLKEVQLCWYANKLIPWKENNKRFKDRNFLKYFKKKCKEGGYDYEKQKESLSFSEPFYTAFYEGQGKNKTVMFVGQETYGYGNINNYQGIDKSHEWMCNTMKVNIEQTNIKATAEFPYNTYPFFRAMRAIAKEYNICWNNLDKIQYISDKVKSMTLYKEDEVELNSEIGEINDKNYETLLIEEIKIIRPDMLVFAVGPRYEKSLNCSLNKKVEDCLKRPNLDNPIQKFNLNVDDKNIPCLWTYHPEYYRGFKIDDVLDAIDALLNR